MYKTRKFIGTLYDDDSFLVSYPRSGNTWIRYVLAHILTTDVELTRASIQQLIPDMYVETDWQSVHTPRIIKSHETTALKPYCIIYLVRDGRDVACSYYDYYCRNHGYIEPFSVFLQNFLSRSFDFGSWPYHVIYWSRIEHKNILVIKYEELWQSPHQYIKKMCDHANIRATTETIAAALEKVSYRKIAQDAGKTRAGLEKGPGAWENLFSERDMTFFKKKAGLAMKVAGYNY